MSDAFVGEIRMFGGNYAPQDWAFCDGSTLSISSYSTLYAVLGVTYGGDGVTNFKLPDLRGRIPVHKGQGTGLTNRTIGSAFGDESVTLTTSQIPAHSHTISVGSNTTTGAPTGNYLSNSTSFNLYSAATPDNVMNTAAVGNYPATPVQPHSNLMPTQCVNFIIALNGFFPTQA